MSTIDLNATQCVREINNIGSYTVQNICSGEMVTVPWGAIDWAMHALFGGIVTATMFMLVGLTVMMLRARW